jgi:hypothetical protein
MKFLSIYTYPRELADPSGPTQDEMMAMGKLIGEMQTAGVLLDFGGVGSDGLELRVEKRGSGFTVTDGPFTESKEIVGGFALISVPSRDDAVKWVKQFMDVAGGDGVSELHELMDGP